MVEKKMQASIDAMGETTRSLDCVFPAWADIYVAGNFIRIGSYSQKSIDLIHLPRLCPILRSTSVSELIVKLDKVEVTSVLSLRKGFNEDALYRNLSWLAAHQASIEDKLFANNRSSKTLFLYDVTSSYLEGTENTLAEWGYNRDGKKGKKQIIIGLLTDHEGNPIATEVFKGNTNDLATFHSQIEKARSRFGCQHITFVGDRGMIKGGQIDDLAKHGFHYITSLTKKQIEVLVQKNVIQYELFDSAVCEVVEGPIRYVFRRNPVRAQEIQKSRANKQSSIEGLAQKHTAYLREHPQAKEITAFKRVLQKIQQLNIDSWLSVKIENRKLILEVNKEALAQAGAFDGLCH